jgi:hypothetical protein
METSSNLISNLEFEYRSIQAANPEWDISLWDFLIDRGVAPDEIWGYSPQIGWDAEQEQPDWL